MLAVGVFLFFPQIWWATYSRVAEYEDDPRAPPATSANAAASVARSVPAAVPRKKEHGEVLAGYIYRGNYAEDQRHYQIQSQQARKARYRAKDPENPHIVHLITPNDDAYYQDFEEEEGPTGSGPSGDSGAISDAVEELKDIEPEAAAELEAALGRGELGEPVMDEVGQAGAKR